MKNIILILLLLFFNSCGYTSVYKNQSNLNFDINIIDMQGDKRFNNLIKNELNQYSSLNSKNKYDVKIKSNFNKTIISKNSAGVATDYLLYLKIKFEINLNNEIKNFEFDEKIKMANNTDSFEQNSYENNIKRNFASSIREKLLTTLANINDN